jgi:hypothetical protein
MRARVSAAAVIMLATALLAGCNSAAAPAASVATGGAGSGSPATQVGGGSLGDAAATTQAKAGSFDACSLITVAEVQSISGKESVAAPTEPYNNPWALATCAWKGPLEMLYLEVNYGDKASVAKDPKAPTAKEQLAAAKASFTVMSKDKDIDLPGIGDGAVYFAGLAVAIKGDKVVQIAAPGFTKAVAAELLKVIVARI